MVMGQPLYQETSANWQSDSGSGTSRLLEVKYTLARGKGRQMVPEMQPDWHHQDN